MIRELTDFAENNTDVVQNLDWYILPVTNPDGYLYTQTDNRLWRKTRLEQKL
jgi:murein tripeptide amidase MpaA